MSWKKTLVLGLIFLCAGAGYFLDRMLTQKRQLSREREEALLSLKKEDVTAFTLTNPEGSFRVEKKEGKWRIVKPLDLGADEDQVESLLTNIGAAKRYDPVETSELEQYGLDNPRETITLECETTGEKQTLYIGVESTSSGRYFATTRGDKTVFTVASHIRNFMDKNLYFLRDKTVFDIKEDDISKIEIAREKEKIILEKRGENEWRISSPVEDKADIMAVRNLLSDIETLRATSFEEDDNTTPGYYGLDIPRIRLSIGCRDTTPTLTIGREDPAAPRFFTQKDGSGEIFTVSRRFVEELEKDAGKFRSSEVFRIPVEDIREIKIIVGDSFVSLVREKDDKWGFQGTPDVPVNQGKVQDLLLEIGALRILSFEDESPASLEPFGLSSPRARLILYPEDREQKEILSFGNKAEDRDICFARISYRPLIFGLDWTKVCNFYLTRHDLQDRRLFTFSSDDIHLVEIREPGQKRYLERKGERWFARSESEVKGTEIPSYEVLGVLGDIVNMEFDTRLDDEKIKVIGDISREKFLEAILKDKDGKIFESFEVFGSDSEPSLTFKTSKGGYFLIAKEKMEKFRSDFDALFEKK
jgi:hypothetical protein